MRELSLMAKRIFEMRNKKGFTQYALGKILNVSAGTISGWETDYCKPATEKLIQLSNILETSIDYLVGLSNIPDIPLKETLVNIGDHHLRILHAFNESELSEDTIIQILKDLGKYKRDL
jgi:transcriptional regulator with XRE-family HTH domain